MFALWLYRLAASKFSIFTFSFISGEKIRFFKLSTPHSEILLSQYYALIFLPTSFSKFFLFFLFRHRFLRGKCPRKPDFSQIEHRFLSCSGTLPILLYDNTLLLMCYTYNLIRAESFKTKHVKLHSSGDISLIISLYFYIITSNWAVWLWSFMVMIEV